MKRRDFALFAAMVAATPAVLAQQARVPRVGILSGRSRQAAVDSGTHAALIKGMSDLGYVDRRNVLYEWRYAGGNYAELRRMAEELARLKVDVIVAEGSSSIEPARDATRTIPIVMSTSSDPVGAGFVSSLARPGGNVTGLTSTAIETTLKRLEILATVVPGLKSVAALTNPNNPSIKIFLKDAEGAARKFKLRLIAVQAGTSQEIEAAFSAMSAQKADALIVPTDALFNSQRRQIVELAAKARIPAIYTLREFVEIGGLLMYGHDLIELMRRSAAYVDKILKGAKPAELPVEQPHTFELAVNLKTANALGLVIPQSLLMRANEVIH